MLIFDLFTFVESFHLQTHVSAHSTDIRMILHVFVHFHESFALCFQTHIKENCIFRSQLFAKTIKEPIVRGKLTSIFILGAEKQVHEGVGFVDILFLLVEKMMTLSIFFLLRIVLGGYQSFIIIKNFLPEKG